MTKNHKREKLSAAETAFQKLEELIVLAELKPGQLYSEKELVQVVGYGRTPVREALQRLQIEGLVRIRQRRGIQITEVDADVQLQLLEVRRPLQNFAAEYAAIRATDQDRAAIRKFAHTLELSSRNDASSKAQALDAVRQAHDLIISACHNEFARNAMRIVQGMSRRFWVYHIKPSDYRKAATLHADLLANIADGNVEASVDASNALVDYLEGFARKTKEW